MAKKIKLEPGYDPDKYRDELNQSIWKDSGYKTGKEFCDWYREKLRNFREAAETRGMSLLEYAIELKRGQAQTNG
jgi:hypothetical protein